MWSSLFECYSYHSSAKVQSFRARIGASGQCTCHLHSYEASSRLLCNVATSSGRVTCRSETLWRLFASVLTISQQSRGLFEHGWVRRDRAQAVCTATRLVAGCGAMWQPSPSSGIRPGLLSVGDIVEGHSLPDLSRDRAHAVCIAARLVANLQAGPPASQRHCGGSQRVFSYCIKGVVLLFRLQFRALIGASGSYTCHLHNYEASGRL